MVKLIIFVVGLLIFFIWQNNHLVITRLSYKNEKIPSAFEGFKIVHISDFHNKNYGKDQKYILNKIQDLEPDIIVITGDLIDRRRYDLERAMVFVEGAVDLAPVYYVAGNHEAWSGKYELIRESLERAGVQVLDDRKIVLEKNSQSIEILGLSDPNFLISSYRQEVDTSRLEASLNRLSDEETFQILLSHRPELIDIYAREKIDLIFSGHAHGGQFRLPFIGGLVAPDQGLNPKYTSGIHRMGNSTLVVSRGIGNSVIPVRIFNRPEIILLTLYKGNI